MPGPWRSGLPSTRLIGHPDHVGAYRDALQQIAGGEALDGILEALCLRIEAQLSGARASILLIADDRLHLQVAAAPSLSPGFSSAVDGAQIGPGVGTCGTALFRGQVVITGDISADPAWAQWRPAAIAEEVAACWSTPFAGENDQLLGTFAVYFRRPRRPEPEELAVLHDAGWLAAIAVQSARARGERDRLAETDRLTGLPDRAAWEASVTARTQWEWAAVYAIGIDGFAAVNESLGYEAGDQLMRVLADRLVAAAGPEAVVARIDGDEFAVQLPAQRNEDDAIRTGHLLRSAMAPPAEVAAHRLHPEATVGLSLNPPGRLPTESLRRAKAALGRARGAGDALALNGLPDEQADDLTLTADLMSGLAAREMRLEYQPIVRLATDEVVQFEALMRWPSARRGPVPPALFIPAAERSGLIRALGRFAITEALPGLEVLLRDPRLARTVGVAVNISALELRDPALVDLVEELLRRWALPPGSLTVEITENVLLHNGSVFDQLARLHDLGSRIAIDDFGVGFSQLTYLREFPFDEIKIDKSFVTDLATDPQVRSIVENMISLARDLDVELVAEGIETVEQRELLQAMDCRFGQGYLLGRPAPAEARPA